MSKDQLPVTIIMEVETFEGADGRSVKCIVIPKGINSTRLELFTNSLEVGQKIEVTYEVPVGNGSYAQLSKIHKCIREMAKESGVTFEEMKLLVKDKAGLHLKDGQFKSFADCSREDLGTVIQTILEMGEFMNMNLNQY